LKWYVAGFAERSQIKVDLEMPEDLGRFRRELELAVFRIVQETLTNVHRHSGSAGAKITLTRNQRQLRMKVEDNGRGMPLPLNIEASKRQNAAGVGISGIRERVRQLGGQMQIRSGSLGTTVEVFFPLEEDAIAATSLSKG
jgi:signal transduction histidine kinase